MKEARLNNPAALLPDALPAIQGLIKASHSADVSPRVLELVHLRASLINGCSVCVDLGARGGKKAGLTDAQLLTVGAWRDATYFSDDERAALALAEAMTRLSDQSDPVPDAIWDEAAKHFNEKQLSAIVLWVATTNFFNRLNVTTRQPAPQNW